MKSIPITTEYIKLDQFLKLAGITGTGGESRAYIAENKILVNGEEEQRRGRKLRPGDIINVQDEQYKIFQPGETK